MKRSLFTIASLFCTATGFSQSLTNYPGSVAPENLSNMKLVSTATVTGDQFYVDPTSIETLPNSSSRIVNVYIKRGYKDVPRPVFGATEGRLQKHAYSCGTNQYNYLESKELDKDRNVVKVEFSLKADDPRITPSIVNKGTISEQIYNYVCRYNATQPNSSNQNSSESKILTKYPGPQDWASLGPDGSNSFDFYLLKNSATKRGNYLGFIAKGEYRSFGNKGGVSYKTQVSENIIDCKQSKSQILKIEYLNNQGQPVLEEKIDPEFAPWIALAKGSFNASIASVYCK